jgi:1-deoxy-D-xylulose-5-phosphate reductoisomerase
MKGVFILGATGSIGENALKVLQQNSNEFSLTGISFFKNVEKAYEISQKFRPKYIFNQYNGNEKVFDHGKMLSDQEELLSLLQSEEVDIVISGISGFAGLNLNLVAAKSGKLLLIANKESIVIAGANFIKACNDYNTKIIPIDSEHNAISQCLDHNYDQKDIYKITLTASGGPFVGKPISELGKVSIEDALEHPNWEMGKKISIDSATMVNKCLELIEASVLFDIPASKLDVVIHPQSILHSMVTYVDGSTIAQLSNPSMEIPIANAMRSTKRLTIDFKELFIEKTNLEFFPLSLDHNEIIDLAYDVINHGGTRGVVFNAANEVAVESFLSSKISFPKIFNVITETYNSFDHANVCNLTEINEYNDYARNMAIEVIKSHTN